MQCPRVELLFRGVLSGTARHLGARLLPVSGSWCCCEAGAAWCPQSGRSAEHCEMLRGRGSPSISIEEHWHSTIQEGTRSLVPPLTFPFPEKTQQQTLPFRHAVCVSPLRNPVALRLCKDTHRKGGLLALGGPPAIQCPLPITLHASHSLSQPWLPWYRPGAMTPLRTSSRDPVTLKPPFSHRP